MDDQINQMPGPVPQQPTEPIGGLGPMGMTPPPPPPPMGGSVGDQHPHEQILAALTRIEEKLVAIAAKVGA